MKIGLDAALFWARQLRRHQVRSLRVEIPVFAGLQLGLRSSVYEPNHAAPQRLESFALIEVSTSNTGPSGLDALLRVAKITEAKDGSNIDVYAG